MLLAVGRASLLAVTGLFFLAAGGVLMHIARRLTEQNDSVAPSADEKQYVWRIDSTAGALPSRFSRASTEGVAVLADQLRGLDLPPSPLSITLQSERAAALARQSERSAALTRQASGAFGSNPPAPPSEIEELVDDELDTDFAEDDGLQQALPLALEPSLGLPPPPVVGDEAMAASAPAEAELDDRTRWLTFAAGNDPVLDPSEASDEIDANRFADPPPALSWRRPDPTDDEDDDVDEVDDEACDELDDEVDYEAADDVTPAVAPIDGVPDHASLVGDYLRKLRSQRGR